MIAFLIICMIADPWADGSPAVEYGAGAGYGQAYYPENILGPPDPDATPAAPSFGENNLLTLGKDGSVVLEFINNSIINEPGVDFTVFENVMDTGSGYFQECAFVEVSQNGSYWIQFPWNPTTLQGLAGLMPTTGNDPTNPEISGGDQFDLEDVGLEWVRFVRLTDCGDAVEDGGLFDLDAVVAVHWSTGIQEPPVDINLSITSPFTSSFTIRTEKTGKLSCYTIDGRLTGQWQINGEPATINASALPSGVLFFTLNESLLQAVKLVK